MMTQLTIKCVIREISTFYSVRARMCMCGSGSSIFLAFVHASWREFAKSRFTHFPSILSVHVDSYAISKTCVISCIYRTPGSNIDMFIDTINTIFSDSTQFTVCMW